MKISRLQNWFAAAGVAIFSSALAQDSTSIAATNPTAPDENSPAVSVTAESAPTLANSVSQVLQLSHAKVSDGTIVNYIQNSGTSYPLAASQIIYLKQQGVSDGVINTMLNQHGAPVLTEAAAPETSSTANATVAPTVTCVQSPSSMVYVVPDSQTYRYDGWYYSYGDPCGYYCYPPVSVSFGAGWGWHDHGWRGGYGGWHGGGWRH